MATIKTRQSTTSALEWIWQEALLCWAFIRYDILSAVIPGLIFGIVALVANDIPLYAWPLYGSRLLLYFSLYLYTFVLSNQYMGVEEDRINKPDRPIPMQMATRNGALVRWFVVTALFLMVAFPFGVLVPAVIWVLVLSLHNFAGWSAHWFTKNLVMSIGVFVQLSAAWSLITPLSIVALQWITFFAVMIFVMIGLQDLRDVQGDRLINRRTMPLAFGEADTRIFLGIVLAAVPFAFHLVLMPDAITHWTIHLYEVFAGWIALWMAYRVLLLRNPRADHISYRLLCLWYCVTLLSGIWLIG